MDKCWNEFQGAKLHLSSDKTSYVYLSYSIGGSQTYHNSFPSISHTFSALHECQWFSKCFYCHINSSSSSYFLSQIQANDNIKQPPGFGCYTKWHVQKIKQLYVFWFCIWNRKFDINYQPGKAYMKKTNLKRGKCDCN